MHQINNLLIEMKLSNLSHLLPIILKGDLAIKIARVMHRLKLLKNVIVRSAIHVDKLLKKTFTFVTVKQNNDHGPDFMVKSI